MGEMGLAQQKFRSLTDVLQGYQSSLAKILPAHLTAERIVRLALADVRRNPALLQCDPKSFALAVMQASTLGLEPGSALGHAYLVPYGKECKLVIGYQGLIELAMRSGRVASIHGKAVHEGDAFDWDTGDTPFVRHKQLLRPGGSDPPALVAAFAVARMRAGDAPTIEVMSAGEVDEIRVRSRSGSSGPWSTDYSQMAVKTVIRRLCKRLPKSVELALAIDADERQERGERPDFAAASALHPAGATPELMDGGDEPEVSDPLKEKLRAVVHEEASS